MEPNPIHLVDTKPDIAMEEHKISADEIEEHNTQIREWDPAFVRKTLRKVDFALLPVLTLIYLCSSLDKSNLGNAKTLGMIKDIGKDPHGQKYALLNSLYYVSYAPFMVPLALLGKRYRMGKNLALAAVFWGIAATCFSAVQNFPGAYACRFFVGLGEAGFSPLNKFICQDFIQEED
ncbi:uncharacterized protein L201_000566 [Kwoniella dendrophila CBS 6074]|uniref:Major facilitator superfamily (MFS) profile domain-containing protein n=1 Tax=Kwoniella dendrophila CBS 6074 TaxID=1295534 RepID=A0AAX4JME2_9TREE